jgi:hypothetical protein
MLVLLVVPAGALGVIRLMVLLGLARNPPRPYEEFGTFDPDDYEIVVEGHTVSARRKAPATTQATEGE